MKDIIEHKYQKFINHMTRPLSDMAIDIIYTTNNVIQERADFYRDFVLSLDNLILSTYLGHELTDEKERVNHFNWCWDKTCVNLNQRNINFTINKTAYVYLLDYYLDFYYSNKILNNYHITDFWEYTFDYNILKSRSDLDNFITIYKILEKSYKKD